MEKSTISALILAGGTALATVFQVLVLRAAKKRKRELREAAAKENEEGLPEEHKDT